VLGIDEHSTLAAELRQESRKLILDTARRPKVEWCNKRDAKRTGNGAPLLSQKIAIVHHLAA